MRVKSNHVINGVNIQDLTTVIEAVKAQPEIARFRFNISNSWLNGGHNRSTVGSFSGALRELDHASDFTMDAAEPPALLGNDEAPNPVEYLLHALAACVTTSMVYHAAAEGIAIEAVESEVEGDLDLRGFLGIDSAVRNGYERIKITIRVKTNANQHQWKKLVTLGPTFSPVYDSVTKGVPVQVCTERK